MSFSLIFPPSPTFTESSLPSLHSKVYIVTGSTSGVGLELAKILYSKSATVYVAARSPSKIDAAIKTIQSSYPQSQGKLERLVVDLSDLSTIKPAATTFLAKEDRLDVLFHNAGVMMPPKRSTSKQGFDLEMGTNCLGPFLLNKLLQPLLLQTASRSEAGSVRVVWVTSLLANAGSQLEKGGIFWDEENKEPRRGDGMKNYMQSKVGDVFLAKEWGERVGKANGVVSVSVHPGLMKTELQRHQNAMMGKIMVSVEFVIQCKREAAV